ncbi:MAG: tRNA (adenosine(37)-N6)-threonylcarbamoyltransferase complex ATPase subunit type 1 TsaE [Clostridia bacterium]|nr:tRNA (adenosine(37)-N6)-threonylcarbamoyltransferase complex ATPase subunit type 1 TsaE [Clostridia bacterium]
MSEFVSHSVEETEVFAESFAKSLSAGDVVALFGGLGMGKTAFVRGLAKGLSVTSEVSSPTFALVHEYDAPVPVYHFDMYRINSLEDLFSTGFFDYLDCGGIVVVEWSENIVDYLPKNTVSIKIEYGNTDSERRIIVKDENSCN